MGIRFVKDLSKHGNNVIKILNDVILGTEEIKEYSEDLTYNIDQLIIRVNNTTNQYEILKCLENDITGVFDPLKWVVYAPLLTNGVIDCGEF